MSREVHERKTGGKKSRYVLSVTTGPPHGAFLPLCCNYHQTFNIRGTIVGNKLVDHSDVVGASPVGAAPTTSSFSTYRLASVDLAKTAVRREENYLSFVIWCDLYYIFYGTVSIWLFGNFSRHFCQTSTLHNEYNISYKICTKCPSVFFSCLLWL